MAVPRNLCLQLKLSLPVMVQHFSIFFRLNVHVREKKVHVQCTVHVYVHVHGLVAMYCTHFVLFLIRPF